MTVHTLTAEDGFERADVFLSERLSLTRSAIKKLIEEGRVTFNGQKIKAGQSIRAGETLTVEIPEPQAIAAKPEDIPIDVVYEDDDIAVINKAQGMTVHAGNGNLEGTLVNALLFQLSSLSGINGAIRPGIVHRIDKDTSGLLVVAKNDRAHLSLSEQIAQKTCKREYLALLEGVLKEDSGFIATDIGRNPADRLQMKVLPDGRGKRAETDWAVRERFARNTLVHFSLRTGRTHQIRVHAKYLGHPVVGDPVYGYKKQRFDLNGQLLHAFRLELTHPVSGERMTFTAPLPDYFERVLQIVRRDV